MAAGTGCTTVGLVAACVAHRKLSAPTKLAGALASRVTRHEPLISGLTLSEIRPKACGLDYKTAGRIVERFADRLGHDPHLREVAGDGLLALSNGET